jgi:hypothetical protein
VGWRVPALRFAGWRISRWVVRLCFKTKSTVGWLDVASCQILLSWLKMGIWDQEIWERRAWNLSFRNIDAIGFAKVTGEHPVGEVEVVFLAKRVQSMICGQAQVVILCGDYIGSVSGRENQWVWT